MGIIKPSSGVIKIDNSNIETFKTNPLNSVFGYVEQNVRIFSAKFYENIIISENIPKNKLDWYNRVISLCELKELTK